MQPIRPRLTTHDKWSVAYGYCKTWVRYPASPRTYFVSGGDMDLSVTITEAIAFLTIFASILGVYFRLAASLTALEEKFTKMETRNVHADQETEAVKVEQAAQKTTVAVMAQQIESQSKTIDRIDRNIEELMKRGG